MSTTETGSVSMAVHDELLRRIADNNAAIEHRLVALESDNSTMRELLTTVAKLAASMESMAAEQHEQREQLHEVYTAVTGINIEYVERKINEHDGRFDDHSSRIRKLEQKPQDSEECKEQLKTFSAHIHATSGHDKRLDDLEQRVDTIEKEPGENYKKMKAAVIAAICSGIGMAVWGVFEMIVARGV